MSPEVPSPEVPNSVLCPRESPSTLLYLNRLVCPLVGRSSLEGAFSHVSPPYWRNRGCTEARVRFDICRTEPRPKETGSRRTSPATRGIGRPRFEMQRCHQCLPRRKDQSPSSYSCSPSSPQWSVSGPSLPLSAGTPPHRIEGTRCTSSGQDSGGQGAPELQVQYSLIRGRAGSTGLEEVEVRRPCLVPILVKLHAEADARLLIPRANHYPRVRRRENARRRSLPQVKASAHRRLEILDFSHGSQAEIVARGPGIVRMCVCNTGVVPFTGATFPGLPRNDASCPYSFCATICSTHAVQPSNSNASTSPTVGHCHPHLRMRSRNSSGNAIWYLRT